MSAYERYLASLAELAGVSDFVRSEHARVEAEFIRAQADARAIPEAAKARLMTSNQIVEECLAAAREALAPVGFEDLVPRKVRPRQAEAGAGDAQRLEAELQQALSAVRIEVNALQSKRQVEAEELRRRREALKAERKRRAAEAEEERRRLAREQTARQNAARHRRKIQLAGAVVAALVLSVLIVLLVLR